MATLDSSTDGDQNENTLTPSKGDSHRVLNDTSAPMMFCNLTPSQFGISVQSFTPASLPNHKDKSRLAKMKARRRSSVGVRGSPETNSLIRFMAQQRMKTPPGSRTPEPVRSGPSLPRVNATLRQKMASFQSLMDVEESVICDPVPKQDSNTGGCIKTRDYLSDGNSPYEGKENHPPKTPPSKRRRLGPLQGCEMEFREAPTPPFSLKEQEDRLFELQSPGQTPPDEASAASPSLPFSHFSLPSLQEVKPPGEDAVKTKKKKSVRFGCPLSPEFFDKALPPSTPLQKGSTPAPALAQAPTPQGCLHPRSVLKTPQRIESQTPQTQRDLSSPTDFGASPTFAIPRTRRVPSVGEDPQEEEGGKIVFRSWEDVEVIEDTERTLDLQPLTLDTAFHEESLSNSLTEIEASLCTPSLTDAEDESASLPEEEKQPETEPEAPTKSRNRRKKQPAAAPAAGSEAPCRSTRGKRKQPEEMEPAMRPTRSAAKSAVVKMKVAARRWSKEVDRSRYGLRVHVCKNPDLSPIAEKPPSPRLTQQTPPQSCTAPNQEAHLNPEFSIDTQATVDLTNVLEDPSEVTSPPSCSESAIGKSRKASVQRERSSGPKKMKVSCADDFLLINQTEGTTEELREDQHTTNQEASRETPVPEEEVDAEQNLHTPAQSPCTDSEGKLDNHGAPNSGGGSQKTLTVQRKTSRGRRSSRNICVKTEQAEPLQTLPDEEAQEQEDDIRSISDSQEEEGGVGASPVNLAPVDLTPLDPAPLDPAPWQDYLHFEDVFKPVAIRGRRSVRRSLRNQDVKHNSSVGGMVWVPHTSPEGLKESRRKTRGRRLGATPPPL